VNANACCPSSPSSDSKRLHGAICSKGLQAMCGPLQTFSFSRAEGSNPEKALTNFPPAKPSSAVPDSWHNSRKIARNYALTSSVPADSLLGNRRKENGDKHGTRPESRRVRHHALQSHQGVAGQLCPPQWPLPQTCGPSPFTFFGVSTITEFLVKMMLPRTSKTKTIRDHRQKKDSALGVLFGGVWRHEVSLGLRRPPSFAAWTRTKI